MDMKYIDPITTIIAVVIGFVLAEGASWLRARSESKGAANTTRSLVEMEIESNKRLLFEYWKTIITSTDKWYSQEGQFNYVKLGREIVRTPFPSVSKQVFMGLIQRLPSTYNSNDIQVKWKVYELIDKMILLHSEIESAAEVSKNQGEVAESRGRPYGGAISHIVDSMHFQENVKSLTEDFTKSAQQVLGERFMDFPKQTT